MILNLNRREKAVIGAALYLGFLFVAIIALGWLILIGGNPLTVTNVGVISATGFPNDRFHPGEVVGIKRQLCADHEVAVQFFPSLIDSRGFRFPLPGGMALAQPGCHITVYGFVAPDLPTGEYTYSNNVLYQNNLVGRDEAVAFPPIRVRIMK